MVVHREVIQSIRLKRIVQDIEQLLSQGDAMASQLLQASGLLDKGIDPRTLDLSPEQWEQLLERARAFEADLLLDETQTRRNLRGRSSV
jgi:hypothetical protein